VSYLDPDPGQCIIAGCRNWCEQTICADCRAKRAERDRETARAIRDDQGSISRANSAIRTSN
jgi:hypothetical protein